MAIEPWLNSDLHNIYQAINGGSGPPGSGLATEDTLLDVLAELQNTLSAPYNLSTITVTNAVIATFEALYATSDNESVADLVEELLTSSLSIDDALRATSDGETAANILKQILTSTDGIKSAVESGSNYINHTNFTKGFAKNITTVTATDVLAAPGASAYNYITQILVTNAHASVGTLVDIVDETTGDVLYTGYAAPAGGGYAVTLPTPIRQVTANKKVQAKCVTTGADVTVSISGYKAI